MYEVDLNNLPPGARYIPNINNKNISFVSKVKSFGKAMASKAFQPAASRAQRRARLVVCAGCSAFKPTEDSRVGFCRACGCGESNPLATLAVKSKILRSSCPRNLWDAAISLPILPTLAAPAPTDVPASQQAE